MICRMLACAAVGALVLSSAVTRAQDNPNSPEAKESKAAQRDAAPYWPQFNGPRGDNRSTDLGLLKTWPEGGPPSVWRYRGCGFGFSSVSVADGMIFTAGAFETEEKVLALSMDGKLLWSVPNGNIWQGAWAGARSTPTYNDGLVYHLNPNGRLAAFEARTGKEVWSFELPHDRLSQGGYAESVIIDGNNLICMPGAPQEFIVALDKKTGKKVWVSDFKQTHWDRASYVTPILVEYRGRKLVIYMSLFHLIAVDARTGKVAWSFMHKTPEHCEVVAVSPVWFDGRVFISKGYGFGSRMFAIDPSGTSVKLLWEHRASDSEHAAVVAHDGCIYVPGNYVYPMGGWRIQESREGSLYCLDAATGRQNWVAPIGRCTLTYADGHVYALDEFGKVRLIEASPKECKVVGEFQVPRENRGQTLTHPVIVGGRMYIRDHNTLHVYDVRERAE